MTANEAMPRVVVGWVRPGVGPLPPEDLPLTAPEPTPEPDYRVALASMTSPTGEILPVLRAVAATPRLLKSVRVKITAAADRMEEVYNEFKP